MKNINDKFFKWYSNKPFFFPLTIISEVSELKKDFKLLKLEYNKESLTGYAQCFSYFMQLVYKNLYTKVYIKSINLKNDYIIIKYQGITL
jgi:hypothetical protein